MPARYLVLFSTALTLFLAACSQGHTEPAAEVDPYANGARFPWSFTAPNDRLATLSLAPGENILSSESILSASNAWGPIESARSNGEQAAGDGKALTINGKSYASGFGTHAGSELRFSLQGAGATCTRFTADVGVDDEVGPRGKVVFQVYLDGKKAYDSGVMKGQDRARRVDVDITGKQVLRLVVTDGGNGIHFDHANWAQPKVLCQAATTQNVGMSLDLQELTVFHKHSANVKATFSSNVNLGGPLDLRLEQAESGRGLNLQLLTTQFDFSGPGTVTRDITIAAPNGLSNNPTDIRAPYRLIASRNGRDVASVPIIVDVRALSIKTHLEPASLSGRDGETRRATVVVTIDPPIEGPLPLSLVFAPTGESSIHFAEIVNVSPTRGDGRQMLADMDIRFFNNPALPDVALSGSFNVQVSVGDIVSYRTPGYGTRAVPLELKLIR